MCHLNFPAGSLHHRRSQVYASNHVTACPCPPPQRSKRQAGGCCSWPAGSRDVHAFVRVGERLLDPAPMSSACQQLTPLPQASSSARCGNASRADKGIGQGVRLRTGFQRRRTPLGPDDFKSLIEQGKHWWHGRCFIAAASRDVLRGDENSRFDLAIHDNTAGASSTGRQEGTG